VPGPRTAWVLPLLLLLACHAGPDVARGRSNAPAPRVAVTPVGSTGCGHGPAASGYRDRTLTVAGQTRHYQLYVPAGVDGTRPLPLVFVFHARDGTIQDAERFGLQDAAAAAGDKAVFVFPQALSRGRAVGWALGCGDHDIQLFDAMLAATEAEECIDTHRIFVTGFSWGADMTIATGCCRGDVVRAIAPTSGTGWHRSGCTAQRPAYRVTIGTADPIYPVRDVHAVTEQYREAQGCSTGTTPAVPSPPCLASTGCNAPVVECVYDGLAHAPPPDGWAHVWRFFAGF
jgi:polyhydroxybutyrate depolymerase